jgi:hypothetical protein
MCFLFLCLFCFCFALFEYPKALFSQQLRGKKTQKQRENSLEVFKSFVLLILISEYQWIRTHYRINKWI